MKFEQNSKQNKNTEPFTACTKLTWNVAYGFPNYGFLKKILLSNGFRRSRRTGLFASGDALTSMIFSHLVLFTCAFVHHYLRGVSLIKGKEIYLTI